MCLLRGELALSATIGSSLFFSPVCICEDDAENVNVEHLDLALQGLHRRAAGMPSIEGGVQADTERTAVVKGGTASSFFLSRCLACVKKIRIQQ